MVVAPCPPVNDDIAGILRRMQPGCQRYLAAYLHDRRDQHAGAPRLVAGPGKDLRPRHTSAPRADRRLVVEEQPVVRSEFAMKMDGVVEGGAGGYGDVGRVGLADLQHSTGAVQVSETARAIRESRVVL